MKNLIGLLILLAPYLVRAATCEVTQNDSENVTYSSGKSTVLGRYHYHFHPSDVAELQDELLVLPNHQDINAFAGRVRAKLASKKIQDAVQRAKSDFQFLNQQIESKKIKWIGMEQTEEQMELLVAQIPDLKKILTRAGLPKKDVETFILALIGPAAYFWYENAGKKGILLVGMEDKDLNFKADFMRSRAALEEANFHEAFKESTQKSKFKNSEEVINRIHDELESQVLKTGKVDSQKYSDVIESMQLDPESQRALVNYSDRMAAFMNLVPGRDQAAAATIKTSAATLGNGLFLYGKAHLPGQLKALQKSCGTVGSQKDRNKETENKSVK